MAYKGRRAVSASLVAAWHVAGATALLLATSRLSDGAGASSLPGVPACYLLAGAFMIAIWHTGRVGVLAAISILGLTLSGYIAALLIERGAWYPTSAFVLQAVAAAALVVAPVLLSRAALRAGALLLAGLAAFLAVAIRP